MAAEISPPELARLVDVAERSRVGDWSLRSALVRYAQPQPAKVAAVLEALRRIEAALHPEQKRFEKDGTSVWAALQAGADDPLSALLRTVVTLDELGDELAAWADDPHGPRPDDRVDEVSAALGAELDRLGVRRESAEDRPRPGPGGRPRSRG